MESKNIYTTFSYRGTRYGVECDSESIADDIALDASSLVGCKNIHIRRSDKPRKAEILSVQEFEEMF